MTMETGSEIRRIRLQLGMTQETFAHAIAVAASTVKRWENDRMAPSGLARRAIETLVQRCDCVVPAVSAPALAVH